MNNRKPEQLIEDYFRDSIEREQNRVIVPVTFVQACANLDGAKRHTAALLADTEQMSLRNIAGGASQVLLGLAASFLIMVFTGFSYSGPLAEQLHDEHELNKIHTAFAELAKQVDEGLFGQAENR